ncbi:MAG: response regulator transcription factor [Polaromonas sp.]|uniref:response regulator transcription factor n=1 Tax=Polaromonas sp. TaxID=1869339 RepID=UPI003265FA23
MARIIVVEDDLEQQEELLSFLSHSGHAVLGASSRAQLLDTLRRFTPDIVLLDYNLGSDTENGASLTRELRERYGPSIGLVMVTARGMAADRVECRRAGADDYLVKPINFSELQVLIDNLRLRLAPGGREQAWRLLVAQSQLDIQEHGSVSLTRWELVVLGAIARSADQQVSREALIEAIGKNPAAYDPRALEAGISRLRRKLPVLQDGRAPLQAVWGHGYKLMHLLVVVR